MQAMSGRKRKTEEEDIDNEASRDEDETDQQGTVPKVRSLPSITVLLSNLTSTFLEGWP